MPIAFYRQQHESKVKSKINEKKTTTIDMSKRTTIFSQFKQQLKW